MFFSVACLSVRPLTLISHDALLGGQISMELKYLSRERRSIKRFSSSEVKGDECCNDGSLRFDAVASRLACFFL